MQPYGKAYVLLSGGIDSTTCLHIAKNEYPDVTGVSMFYGQRHRKEIEYAQAQCARLQFPHRILDVSAIVPRTMLTDASIKVPDISYSEIKGVSPTYVPFRNGLMLSAVTSFVAGEQGQDKAPGSTATGEWAIYFGAHAEDAHNWAYPDCTPEFIGAMANAIFIGSYQNIRLKTPLEWLDKRQIIELGTDLGVDWANTWSCYKGEPLHCGICPTCRARRRGFADAAISDPTEYAQLAA